MRYQETRKGARRFHYWELPETVIGRDRVSTAGGYSRKRCFGRLERWYMQTRCSDPFQTLEGPVCAAGSPSWRGEKPIRQRLLPGTLVRCPQTKPDRF